MKLDMETLSRMYSICEILGLPVKEQLIVCPLPDHAHHNNTPSFSIKIGRDGKEVFRCHGSCGHYGDAIDLIGYMYISFYDREDYRSHSKSGRFEAANILMKRASVRVEIPEVSRVVGIDQSVLEELLPPGEEATHYAVSRGIAPSLIKKFRLGQKGMALAIPSFEEGVLMGVKYRSLAPDGARYWSEKGSRMSLFNYDEVANTEEPVFVAKGEIAVMVLASYGFLACCTTVGEGAAFPQKYADLLVWSRKITVIGDNDRPEVKERLHKTNLAKAELLKANLFYPPTQYKDVDEWLVSDPEAHKILRSLCT